MFSEFKVTNVGGVITPTIRRVCLANSMGNICEEWRTTSGDKLGYMTAFVEYGLRDTKLGSEFKKGLTTLLEEYR